MNAEMRDLKELVVFPKTEMSMSELYQPAIILYLLQQDGEAQRDELARILSGYDESVLDYYRRVVMRWPKRTLEKHRILDYDRRRQIFKLNFDISDTGLAEAAKEICLTKTQEWIEKRNRSDQPGHTSGSGIHHRLASPGLA